MSDIKLSPLEIREDIDTRLNISFVLSSTYQSVRIDVFFNFNDNHGIKYQLYGFFPRIEDYSSNFSSYHVLNKNDLIDGTNYIYLYPYYQGTCGEYVNASFKYIMKKPILSITALDNQKFKKNDNEFFIINGTVKCDYDCQKIKFFYQFDGYEENEAGDLPIQSQNECEFNYKAPFPSNMTSRNNHSISIWAIDSSNKSSSIISRNFSYFDVLKSKERINLRKLRKNMKILKALCMVLIQIKK
ncbi:hypothetical protein TVAG_241560 [Trichomonas vaginalis G3]|uniref:Uncharacterized protein n=1 Tax=Trichomonas vaginalis (strain ATCC PRA-98 / G3) TaxID=412133 RepID=A2FL04_TRIV3|nr:hypothetical protein TVAGG3_0846490 [Trichomonas vaginalis G3]EAX94420.1 hypothetical protein TVAG_241560 [Trichomonas vaginalis G3]KAI5499654.1 hypothetical protein TVAGG3_0846490 [Trichomonas vaginalis G3]|eukprot:XP_001307350.1 hypothetical protein [Trichomonas vaginalis G3]